MRRLGNTAREMPGRGRTSGQDRDLGRYIRDNAWGHHASCTNKMGPASDPLAIVDQNFRVHGTEGLRVVDASVFARIPGFFIVASVYMLAEKCASLTQFCEIAVDAASARRGMNPRECLR